MLELLGNPVSATVVAFIVLTSVWVFIDSWVNRVTGQDADTFHPFATSFFWLLLMILLWAVAFPWYLVRRTRKINLDRLNRV